MNVRTCLAMVLLAAGAACAQETTWAQRLGYKPDQKVVILSMNGIGAAYDFNLLGTQLLKSNQIHAAGVLVNGQWFHEFADWNSKNHAPNVGIALSLISPNKLFRLRPLSKGESLTDSEGSFWSSLVQIYYKLAQQDVADEVKMQLDVAKKNGLAPTYLTAHLGTLLTRPDLFDIYLSLAEKHWIPAVIVEMKPDVLERLEKEGLRIDEPMLERLARYPLPKLDHVATLENAGSYDETVAEFKRMIKSLKPGLTQVLLGPASDSPALRRVSERWQQRVWEAKLLQDKAVWKFLQDEGVVFSNWKEVMRRFEHGSKQEAPAAKGEK